MDGWAFFLFVALVVAAVVLGISDLLRRQHELTAMEKMRHSRMYHDLYPLVRQARRYQIDRVRIERGRVLFYGISPAGVIASFSMHEMGYRPLRDENIRALTLVLAEDIAPLQDKKWYRLRRYPVYRSNGKRSIGYQYTVTLRYKAVLMRSRSFANNY